MKYYLFLGLTIASIISQLPHAWYTFNSFSKLEGWLKNTQAVMFCGILSVAIFGFVWIGKPKLAMIGAAIEIVINLYYYSIHYWQRKGSKFDWRKNWIAVFFGILLPALIYIFSEQMIALK